MTLAQHAFLKTAVIRIPFVLVLPDMRRLNSTAAAGRPGRGRTFTVLERTLHQLVTGRNPSETPFHFPKITQCRPQLLWETPKKDRDLLFGLEAIIDRCTSYDADARYPSAKDWNMILNTRNS